MSKRSAGFIHLIPLLIITFIAISVLALSIEPKSRKTGDKAVLSESESGGGGGHGSDSSGSSGGTSGSSGGSGSTSGSSSGGGTSETSKPSSTIRPVGTGKPEAENEHALPEIENETEFEVNEGTETAKIKLGKIEDKFAFFEESFGAESEFPVSVNRVTHQLTITTPQGTKVVAVLPDAAIENMLGQNVIDRVLGANGQLVEAKIDANGNVFYEVSGVKDEKLLGLFAVAVPKTVDISTQTGNITSVSQSIFSQLLDAISF